MRIEYSLSWLLAAIALLIGCVPDRVVWSPDGTRAAIVGDDGLHICDVAGKLSPVLVTGVKCVAWMPDSKRVVVGQQRELRTWKEASDAFPDDAAVASRKADAVRSKLLTSTAGWSAFTEASKEDLQLTDVQLTLALLNLREHDGESLAANLDKESKEAIAGQSILSDVVQVYEIGDSTASPAQNLYRRAILHGGVQSLCVAPTGTAVVLAVDVSVKKDQQEPRQLLVVSTAAPEKVCDLGRGAAYPDWTPDGSSVVFISPSAWKENPTEVVLAVLAQQRVTDAKGQLLDSDHLPKREDLAGLLFDNYLRVRVAKDGRIFFSAADVSLPVTEADFNAEATIFSFDPAKQATLTRVVPKGVMQTIGNAAQYFELSADARYLSIPFTDGRVSVLDIAKGEAQLLQGDREGNQDNLKLATIPQWRTPTELTFVRPVKDSTTHEVVRYSIPEKTATVISGDWPASIGGWIHPEEGALNKPAPSEK